MIGRSLAQKGHLTGTEFRFLRKELDLSQHRLADLIGTTEQTVALWEKRGKIPKTADRMLRAIYLETIDGNVKLKEMTEHYVRKRQGDKASPTRQDFAEQNRAVINPAKPDGAGDRT